LAFERLCRQQRLRSRAATIIAPVQLSTAGFTDRDGPAKPSELSGLPPWQDIIGREREIAVIQDDLRSNQHVTVVGTAGIGKTTRGARRRPRV
jgi:hypothetical protein